MESIVRSVKDIDADKRTWIESAIGRRLQENQQLIIHVVDVGTEPDAETRSRVLDQAAAIAAQGRANAAAQSVAEDEIDAAIDEAIGHARRHRR
jgi:hypothetical protein